jgi:predicted SprT family Zn-dependent metalloprotease
MALGGELERGIRTEKEHIDTLRKLYENRLTPNQAITEIAKEHIAESPTYYSDLEKTMNVDAQSLQDLENIIINFSHEEKNYPPYESSDFQIDRLTKYKFGGELKSSCGCNHTKKYMDGGIFGGGIEALESFADDSKDKYAEKCVRIISSAREILNQDLKAKLLTSKLDSSLHKYFIPFNKINLYDDGWRFAYGESKQWAGLCASHGLEQDRGKKTLYLSVDFAKYDAVFEEHFKEVVYHEMAHALVFEYIVSKIGKQAMMQIDPLYFVNTPEQPIGHGQIWKLICSVLDADCDMFYRKAKYGDSFEMFKYECKNCGQKKYGNSRNFAEICFRCFEAVSVIKNNE